MMSIRNQEFGIPRKYQHQIGIWYLCPKFLGIFLLFYQYVEYDPHKCGLILVFFGEIKIGLVFFFFVIAISLVSVWFQFVIFLKMASLVKTE